MIAVAVRLAPLNRREGEGGAPERVDPFGCIKLPAASRPTAISCSAWNSGVNNRAGIVAALLVEK